MIRFADTSSLLVLPTQHDHGLAIVSVLIAVVAAFASVSHVALIRHAQRRVIKYAWLLSGSVTLGLGVWAMHFVGMLAFELPIEVRYLLVPTLWSVLPAVLSSVVVLQVLLVRIPRPILVVIGGMVMGSGIGAMHYLGMSAMMMSADIVYDAGWFLVSLIVAMVMATLALSTVLWLRQWVTLLWVRKLVFSVVMGLAVSTMHYVAMFAARFVPNADVVIRTDAWLVNKPLIAAVAGLVMLAIAVIMSLNQVFMRRVRWAQHEASASQERVRELYERLTKISARVPGVVYQFRRAPDGQYSFPYASEAIRTIYRVAPSDVSQDVNAIAEIIHPDDLQGVLDAIEQSANALTIWQQEYRVRFSTGEVRWLWGNAIPQPDTDGGVSWYGFISDITERKASEETINRLAFYDALTNLPNRQMVQERLGHSIALSARQQTHGAVLYIDLDNFKQLNDTQGHSMGDRLLVQVARLLESCTRANDTLARLGGDEFLLVLEGLGRDRRQAAVEAERVARKVISVLNQPIMLDERAHHGSASIGVNLFLGSQHSVEELLQRADIAMYQAKDMGRNAIRFFDPEMHAELETNYALESALWQALPKQELVLYFQEQVDEHGTPIGVESLIRWQHPEHGLVPPNRFIPLAERSELINKLGQWVLETACQQLALWQRDERTAHLTVAVNVSAKQFHQPQFVEEVLQCLARYHIAPGRLKLELTETLVLADIDDTLDKMKALKKQGIIFSMDDFGTGYSSLAYLSRLPFDEVKIDQAFVHRAGQQDSVRDWVIVEAIIGLAHNLDMGVIAEGVETLEQQQLLASSQCFRYQGYLFSKPIPIEALESRWFESS